MLPNLHGQEILITGGTGSLGKTLTKILLKGEYGCPRGLRLYSRDEYKQHAMRLELAGYPNPNNLQIVWIVGDVRDFSSLYRAMENVDLVINTAAMKQVPACEDNPLEAVRTNVHGAENIINAALQREVARVVQVSTDKAVHPVNLYGATKLTAEKLFIQGNVYVGRKRTRFSVCRYGNVLGSRGSVLPLFKQQIALGGPITVTDQKMTRFWITLPIAARFILDRVLQMEGKEIFVPKMGAMPIMQMVHRLLPGNAPMIVKYTGIRAGEKLHELLIAPEEPVLRVWPGDCYLIHPDGQPGHPFDSQTAPNITPELFTDMLTHMEER